MRVSTNKTSKETLFNVEVPENKTIISYEDMDNICQKALNDAGYKIKNTVFRSSVVSDAAYAIHFLDKTGDFTPVLIWSNNYNKKTRAYLAIGFYVEGTNGHNVVITESSHNNAKNSDDIKKDYEEILAKLVPNIENIDYISKTMYLKMSNMFMTDEDFGAELGKLFMNNTLKGEQLTQAKKESIKPEYNYSAAIESVWVKFNSVLKSMSKTHPQNYLLDNEWVVNVFENYEPETIVSEYNTLSDASESNEILSITTEEMIDNIELEIKEEKEIEEVIDKNQLTILDQIEDMEASGEIVTEVKAEEVEEEDIPVCPSPEAQAEDKTEDIIESSEEVVEETIETPINVFNLATQPEEETLTMEEPIVESIDEEFTLIEDDSSDEFSI